MHRPKLILAVLGAVAVAFLTAGTASRAAVRTDSPPGGVYTCAWIAANPIAADQAAVSCSATAPPIVAGMLPAKIVTPAGLSAGPDTSGEVCLQLPSSGLLGKGVFAWTPSYYYSYEWTAQNNGYAGPNYTWYVQNEGGTNVYNETDTDWYEHPSPNLGSNYYRGGVQNHSTTNSTFTVCYIHS